MLDQFPTHELDEPATKEFVRAEIAVLRTEMHQLANRLFISLTGVMVGAVSLAVTLTRVT